MIPSPMRLCLVLAFTCVICKNHSKAIYVGKSKMYSSSQHKCSSEHKDCLLNKSSPSKHRLWFIKSYNFGGNLPMQFIENALYKRYSRECNMIGKSYREVQDMLGYPSAVSKETNHTKYIYEAYRYKDSISRSIQNTTIRFTFTFKEGKVIEQSGQVLKLHKQFALIK